MTTWVVVADSSRARFFVRESHSEFLQELDGVVHPEGRMHGQDEFTDRPGGIAGSHDEGNHRFEAETSFKEHEAEVFAGQIADRLEHGRVNHDYRKLILVAPPAFLGVLRQVLNKHILELVSGSMDKNLVGEDAEEIRKHIL
ncbi:MAG: host attachment protein [Methylococcales bacterium]|nr:host attachment protein [Methylococcales bacterium]